MNRKFYNDCLRFPNGLNFRVENSIKKISRRKTFYQINSLDKGKTGNWF